MPKEMVINAAVPNNIRVAIVVDGRLDGFFEETLDKFRTRGNIYLGKVRKVEPSLEAGFVEYGESRQGFLPKDEIVPVYWSSAIQKKRTSPTIQTMIRQNQDIVVQVDKEPTSTKGSRLTTDVSLAGRYLVLMPYSDRVGVSRKIEDQQQRREYREIGAGFNLPIGMGFILRTAALGQSKRALARDMNYLVQLWKDIQSRAKQASQPSLLHTEAGVIQRALRDYYTDDIDQIWVDDTKALQEAMNFIRFFMPHRQRSVKEYSDKTPIFSRLRIEEQIEAIHERKVNLSSGGSLVIEQTEALVAIDVNSGKMKSHGSQEETAFKTNLEAASEIARQLRLRNLGGIVIIDFIDLADTAHKTAVERSLKQAMNNDKARHQIGKISSFGLCTLTRQRLDQSIHVLGYRECSTCKGAGVVRTPDAIAIRLLRKIQSELASGTAGLVRICLHPDLANHLQNKHRSGILALEHEFSTNIEVEAKPALSWSEEQLEFNPHFAEQPQVGGSGVAPEQKPMQRAADELPQPIRAQKAKKKGFGEQAGLVSSPGAEETLAAEIRKSEKNFIFKKRRRRRRKKSPQLV